MKNQFKAAAGSALMGASEITGGIMAIKAAAMAGMTNPDNGVFGLTMFIGTAFCGFMAGKSLGKGILHPVRDFDRLTNQHTGSHSLGWGAGALLALYLIANGPAMVPDSVHNRIGAVEGHDRPRREARLG